MVREEMQCCERLRNVVRGCEMACEAGKYCRMCFRMHCMCAAGCCKTMCAAKAPPGRLSRASGDLLMRASGFPGALMGPRSGGHAQGIVPAWRCSATGFFSCVFLHFHGHGRHFGLIPLGRSSPWPFFPAVFLWAVLPGRSSFERFFMWPLFFWAAFPSGLRPCATKGRSRFFAGARRARQRHAGQTCA